MRTTANYYPEKSLLTIVDKDNNPVAGFIGKNAHEKVQSLSKRNDVFVFTVTTKPVGNLKIRQFV